MLIARLTHPRGRRPTTPTRAIVVQCGAATVGAACDYGAAVGEIVLIRHGETAWTRSGQHTSRTDIPLTQAGRDVAVAIGRRLRGRSFAVVLTSPMARARETCELAGYGDDAVVDPDLREWDYGDDEGRTTAEIRRTRPGWTVWTGGPQAGETVGEVGQRADAVLTRVAATAGDSAIFGHGHMLRVLTRAGSAFRPWKAASSPSTPDPGRSSDTNGTSRCASARR